MNAKTKLLGIGTVLIAALFLTPAAPQAGATQSMNAVTVTKFRMNGLSCDTFLVADTTNGFLNVGRDEIANTTAIDFSYATPDATDPDIVILVQGSGEIPNSSFTISPTAAHLSVTTPFPSHRCVVNVVTAVFVCADGEPITFDLTWAANGLGSLREKTRRTETFGPLTTTFRGEFESRNATVNGTWTGHTASDLLGNLVDHKNATNVREIALKANP